MYRKIAANVLMAFVIVGSFWGASYAANLFNWHQQYWGRFYLIGNTIAQVGNQLKIGINYTAVTGGSTNCSL